MRSHRRVHVDQLLSKDTMAKLPTHRLLAYYKTLQRGVSYNFSTGSKLMLMSEDEAEDEALKLLAQAKANAKEILDAREHVEKK